MFMTFSSYNTNPSTPGDTPDVDHTTAGEEAQRTMNALLPWMVSILMHSALALLAVFVVWSAAVAEEEEVIIPKIATFMPDNNPALSQTEQLAIDSPTTMPVEAPAQDATRGEPLAELVMYTETDLLIGVESQRALTVGTRTGTGESSDVFRDGPPGTGHGPARSVVFVVDASGSMIDSLPFVLHELKAAIGGLNNDQRFTIIFFQRDAAIEVSVPSRGMKRATPDNIRLAADWITLEQGHLTPGGSSNPTRALQLALAYRPELIHILSDNITGSGRHSIDQAELLRFIRETKQRHNAHDTRINTIQFLYPDPLNTLKKIAAENNGYHREITADMIEQGRR